MPPSTTPQAYLAYATVNHHSMEQLNGRDNEIADKHRLFTDRTYHRGDARGWLHPGNGVTETRGAACMDQPPPVDMALPGEQRPQSSVAGMARATTGSSVASNVETCRPDSSGAGDVWLYYTVRFDHGHAGTGDLLE